MKNKDIKLSEIKKHSPSLYQKVVDGDVKLQQAYNEVMGSITSTKEYKGRGTKGQNKIGLSKEDSLDSQLIQDLLKVMEGTDFTLAFRHLSQVFCGDKDLARNLFKKPNEFDDWEQRWRKRLEQEGVSTEETAQAMDRVNPIYIPRKHKVEEAPAAATHQADITVFSKLLTIVTRPFEEVEGNEAYTEPAPATNIPYRTFCGT